MYVHRQETLGGLLVSMGTRDLAGSDTRSQRLGCAWRGCHGSEAGGPCLLRLSREHQAEAEPSPNSVLFWLR
jgi:hypothetical protein